MPTLDCRAKNGPVQNQIGGGYFKCAEVANTLARRTGSGRNGADLDTYVAHTLKADGCDASEDGTGRGIPLVAFSSKDFGADANDSANDSANELAPTLRIGGGAGKGGAVTPAIASSHIVRRLTPEECESLQAFPRGYTAVPYRGKQATDGPRYRALGNSMTTTIPKWIGERIQLLEELLAEKDGAA